MDLAGIVRSFLTIARRALPSSACALAASRAWGEIGSLFVAEPGYVAWLARRAAKQSARV